MTTIENNPAVRVICLLLIAVLTFISSNSVAQAMSDKADPYKGLHLRFGTRAFKINSSVPQIDQTFVVQTGGQIGLVFGGKVFRSKIGLLGYYSSVNNIKGTIEAMEGNIALNFYPLGLNLSARPRLEPYISGQLAYVRTKFYGHYLNNNDAGGINYSTAEATYLGSINHVAGSFGAGVEYKLIDKHDFIHVFTEVRYGYNISNYSNNTQFENTFIAHPIEMNIGVSFGAHRQKN